MTSFLEDIPILFDSSQHHKRGDFNARIENNILILPMSVKNFVRLRRIYTARALLIDIQNTPYECMKAFGWYIQDVAKARNILEKTLYGILHTKEDDSRDSADPWDHGNGD